MLGGEAPAEVLEVELGPDVHGLGRHAEAGGHLGAVPVQLGAQQAPQVTGGEVVVDLEGQGALPRSHRPEREAEHPHGRGTYTRVIRRAHRRRSGQ